MRTALDAHNQLVPVTQRTRTSCMDINSATKALQKSA